VAGGVGDGAGGYRESDSGGDHRRQDPGFAFRALLIGHWRILYLLRVGVHPYLAANSAG
jgi:hypothetical protein